MKKTNQEKIEEITLIIFVLYPIAICLIYIDMFKSIKKAFSAVIKKFNL